MHINFTRSCTRLVALFDSAHRRLLLDGVIRRDIRSSECYRAKRVGTNVVCRSRLDERALGVHEGLNESCKLRLNTHQPKTEQLASKSWR